MVAVRFEWDEAKRQQNLIKHSLDFADGHALFSNPRLVRLDTRYDYGEDRWITIGFVKNRVVVVVYTEDVVKKVIRIISMRKATGYEQKRFKKFLAN